MEKIANLTGTGKNEVEVLRFVAFTNNHTFLIVPVTTTTLTSHINDVTERYDITPTLQTRHVR